MQAKTPQSSMFRAPVGATFYAPVGASWTRLGKSCLAIVLAASMAACNVSGLSSDTSEGADSDSATTALTGTDAFPSDLTVASPFSLTESSTTGSSLIRALSSASPSYSRTYDAATATIDEILTGTSPADCTFDPEMFLVRSNDAECYGPAVAYEEHPEGSAGNSGELPTGDLGLWEDSDVTGDPCAVAEFNARMDGITSKTQASLMGLASLVCVVNTEGYSMPSSSVLDLTADMNDLALSGVTFDNASIGHQINSDGDDEYTYNMRFEYDDGSLARDMVVDMKHIPTGTTDEYTGHLSYLVNDNNGFGNCPDPEVTHNGSLRYARESTDIVIESRDATFCGADADGRVVGEEYIDETRKYPAYRDGWSDNFSILTAAYDTDALDGNYSYVWQAGSQDSNTRAFNLAIATDASETIQTGGFFFGYGEEIESTDGAIVGFICNWVAPGSDHSVADYAQYQEIEYDMAASTFAIADSNIGYAPTTTCDYDGSGSFIFDTDGDGDLTDETHSAVTNDLLPATDVDLDGTATIAETIADTGFSVPVF